MPGVYIGFLLTLPNCKISADSSVMYLVGCNKMFKKRKKKERKEEEFKGILDKLEELLQNKNHWLLLNF